VKSLQGKRLAALEIAASGVVGDRARALRDCATGRIMSGKPWERPFECAARSAPFPCGPGGFFDAAPLHLLTNATLAALERAHPTGPT
jgi:uncharacterized protein YcbX